mgnify:CR=1 FL=1
MTYAFGSEDTLLDDIIGNAGWPGALLIAVLCGIWAFNVHEDRAVRHDLRVEIVHECADAESPKTCGKNIRIALGEL